MMQRKTTKAFILLTLGALVLGPSGAFAARDAAFLDPGATSPSAARSEVGILVEPKSDIDVGDTAPNIGRRVTFFFVNQTNMPANVESIAANGDSNVRAEIVTDDCSKGKVIAAGSRCSVTVEVTPVGTGSWTSEVLLTHNAVGRIARARILGRTQMGAADKRDLGLSLNTKDTKPVDFGEVVVGSGKAVRTALMVNDSTETISLLSIEVIAADNGLERLDQGCSPDMDLKTGESCPVTLIWRPASKSNVSTDLIIRHTGRLGFAVIPVRGLAKELVESSSGRSADASSNSKTALPLDKNGRPQPPSVADLAQLLDASNIPPLSDKDIPSRALSGDGEMAMPKATASLSDYHLIGTVGNRALIFKPDGSTSVVGLDEEIESIGDKPVKLTNISSKSAEIFYDGKRRTLNLEEATALTRKARATRADSDAPLVKSKKKLGPKSPEDDKETSAVPLPVGKK